MSDIQIWYENNDMVIEISDVKDAITGNPIDGATITGTLKDSAGVDVPGITWPQTIPNVGTGLYRLAIDKAAQVMSGEIYTLFIVLVTPGGVDGYWEVAVGGEVRTQ